MVWVGVAGGAAAAGLVAASGGGGTTSTATGTPPATTGPTPTTTTTAPAPLTIAGSWLGSVASSPTTPFGGLPYCEYSITLSDVRVTFDVSAALVVSNAVVTLTATERTVPSCPFQSVIPPNRHTYSLSSQQTTSGSVQLNFAPASANAPSATLEMPATLDASGATMSARLLFHRSDQPAPLDWRVNITTTLTRTR